MRLGDFGRLYEELLAMILARRPVSEIVEKMRSDVPDVGDRRSLIAALEGSRDLTRAESREAITALKELLGPRWTPQNRPYVDGANPAIGGGAQARVL
jgi:hypothetical protein